MKGIQKQMGQGTVADVPSGGGLPGSPPHGTQEIVRAEWLEQVTADAQVDRLLGIVEIIVSADNDESGGVAGLFPNLLDNLQAAETGHFDVYENDIRAPFHNQAVGGQPVSGGSGNFQAVLFPIDTRDHIVPRVHFVICDNQL